jgi:hypothetical protein
MKADIDRIDSVKRLKRRMYLYFLL